MEHEKAIRRIQGVLFILPAFLLAVFALLFWRFRDRSPIPLLWLPVTALVLEIGWIAHRFLVKKKGDFTAQQEKAFWHQDRSFFVSRNIAVGFYLISAVLLLLSVR